ncbi:diphthine methyl ester synthase isoform X2 [Tachypleus tridentatus]|uniref:diphthine methyl ester synthase isoform X2 n=1 Tax=Tachypleus tridentatus TaxID=6853 RepID=UPI003FD603EB
MLYFVGLGLGDARDITVKGLEVIRKSEKVYLEAYTSILTVGKEALEEFYGKHLILADRDMVEQHADVILNSAKEIDVSFLVVGDPFGATTHTDLLLRAHQAKIPYKVVHNASIINAVGCCGLQLYNFGETVSIVFWTDDWKPDSFYNKILANKTRGLHTHCLLDIKVKEQSIENLMRGNKIYDPPRYMSAAQAAQQLLEIIQKKRVEGCKDAELAYTERSVCVGLARVGSDDQKIVVTTLQNMTATDLGLPLHTLVIPGHMHPLEIEMLKLFADDLTLFEEVVLS